VYRQLLKLTGATEILRTKSHICCGHTGIPASRSRLTGPSQANYVLIAYGFPAFDILKMDPFASLPEAFLTYSALPLTRA